MYTDNNKISDRQIYRQMITGMLGIMLLVVPTVYARAGLIGGIVICAVGFILSNVYMWGMKKLQAKFLPSSEYTGICEYKRKSVYVYRGYVIIRYILLLVLLLVIYVEVVRELMLAKLAPIVIIVSVLAAIVYMVRGSYENMSRTMEVLYYGVIIPPIILTLLAISRFDIEVLGKSFDTGLSLTNVYIGIVFLLFIVMPGDFMLVMPQIKYCKAMIKANTLLWTASLALYVVMAGIIGVSDMRHYRYPYIQIGRVAGIPGSFMEHQEIWLYILSIISLVAAMSLVLKMVISTVGIKKKRVSSYVTIGISVMIAAGTYVVNWYMGDYGGVSDIVPRVDSVYTGVEIEDSDYALLLGTDYFSESGQFRIYSAQADIARLADSAPDSSACKHPIYEGEGHQSISKALHSYVDEYNMSSNKLLNLSHVEVIVLSVDMLTKRPETTKYLVWYLRDTKEIARNTIVCVTYNQVSDIVDMDKNVSDSIGIYLRSLLKNSKYQESNIVKLMRDYSEYGQSYVVEKLLDYKEYPQIRIEGEGESKELVVK